MHNYTFVCIITHLYTLELHSENYDSKKFFHFAAGHRNSLFFNFILILFGLLFRFTMNCEDVLLHNLIDQTSKKKYNGESMYIEFGSPDFSNRVVEIFKETGIVVVTKAIDSEFCVQSCQNMAASLTTLTTASIEWSNAKQLICKSVPEKLTTDSAIVVDDKNDLILTKTKPTSSCNSFSDSLRSSFQFSNKMIPWGPQLGMFHSMVGNLPTFWSVRTHNHLREIYSNLYSGLRGKQINEFFTSIDGGSFHPANVPVSVRIKPDWPHLDRSTADNGQCEVIQAQVVLNNTQSAFRASPRSHLIYGTWDRLFGKTKETDYRPFAVDQIDTVRNHVLLNGGEYQIPIYAPAGSIIFWDSRIIHSSYRSPLVDNDQFPNNWRFVVYVCFVPQIECKPNHHVRLQKAYNENRITTHNGKRMFGTSPAFPIKNYSLQKYIGKSGLFSVYDVIPKPKSHKINALITWSQNDNHPGNLGAADNKKRKSELISTEISPSEKKVKLSLFLKK